MKKILKKKIVIFPAIAVVLIIVIVVMLGSRGNGATRVTAEEKTITQTVLAAGKTKAVDFVDLGFDKSGQIAAAYVDVGSRVNAGDILVVLDDSELQADLAKAKASLSENSATVATENIAVADAIANAKAVILDSFTKTDSAVRYNIDQFFKNPGGGHTTEFKPTVQDGASTIGFENAYSVTTRVSIDTNRQETEIKLKEWKKKVDTMSSVNIDSIMSESEVYLRSVRDFVDQVSIVIFSLSDQGNANAASAIAGFKSDVSSARSSINTALSNLISAREKINTARATENKTSSGSAQEAKKLQLEAQIQSINSQISKTRIRAPFSGVVTKQEVKPGEIVSAGENIISVISDSKLEVEANVSEVNIGKINVGNPVEITFDAYPNESFTGKISYIDPAETIVDGVVNYKVKVAFDSIDPKIKSGLTTNLTFKTAERTNAVSVPIYSIYTRDGKSFVRKVSADSASEVEVNVGVVGQDGAAEIISGLLVGDIVEISK